MTPLDLGRRDAPGAPTGGPGVVAQPAPGDGEAQAERSDEPFALLRAAIERPEDPQPAGGARA